MVKQTCYFVSLEDSNCVDDNLRHRSRNCGRGAHSFDSFVGETYKKGHRLYMCGYDC